MKKKGLIISTVVMAVVLIASLTTATYAWFSATAEAKVSTMEIKSAGSKGLTISNYDGSQWSNGTIDPSTTAAAVGTPATWKGSNNGQGSSVEYTTTGLGFFGTTGDGFTMLTAGEQEASVSGTSAATLYKATENYDYFAAVLDLQNTETTKSATDVTATINVSASGEMATAARIALFAYNGSGDPSAADIADSSKWTLKIVFAPFGTSVKSGSTWGNGGSTANTYYKVKSGVTAPTYTTGVTNNTTNIENGTFTPTISVDDTLYSSSATCSSSATTLGSVTSQGDQIYVRLVIWYEGTDAQCIANYAGTAISVGISFAKATA